MIWVQAENSKIDPSQDPLPLVMFGAKCRFRPIALEALQTAGRTWEIVYVGGSLNSVQTAGEADLGLSVLSPLSFSEGILMPNNPPPFQNFPPPHFALLL